MIDQGIAMILEGRESGLSYKWKCESQDNIRLQGKHHWRLLLNKAKSLIGDQIFLGKIETTVAFTLAKC